MPLSSELRALQPVRVAVLAAAVLPAVVAVAVAAGARVDSPGLARLSVTAAVYAPVAIAAWAVGRRDIAVLTGALAVTSGWLAGVFATDLALEADLSAALGAIAAAAIVAEAATIALLPWLMAQQRGRVHRIGVRAGQIGVAVTAVAAAGVAVGWLPTVVRLCVLVWALVSFTAGVALLLPTWRGADARARSALSMIGLGAVLLLVGYLRVAFPTSQPVGELMDAVFVLAQVFLPLGILALVGPRRLPRFVLETVAGVLALAAAVSAYLVVRGALGLLDAPASSVGAFSAGVLALTLGAVVRPVRGRLDRLFAPPTPDAAQLLADLGRSTGSAAGRELRGVAAALRESWGLASVQICVDRGDGAASRRHQTLVGRPADEHVTVTLSSGGHRVGDLTVTAAEHEHLHVAVGPVLNATASLIAVAVLLAVTNDEVAATRRRTLGVRREERRLLHATLHDRVAPSLAGLGFSMVAADTLLAHDDQRWRDTVTGLRAETAACTQDVRLLARSLLPAALEQGDLEAALHELAGTVRRDALEVRVEATGTAGLATDLQLGVYMLVAEAFLLAQHDPAVTTMAAVVEVGDGEAVVRLDWQGESPEIAAAAGDRVEELGGRTRQLEAQRFGAAFDLLERAGLSR